MEIRVAHSLERALAAERVRAAAARHDVRPEDPSRETDYGGALQKDTPLGSVRATWIATASEVVVCIEGVPAFVPEATVRRLLEDGLRQVLAS